MANIKKIWAYEIIDSRGYPTIESRLLLDNGLEVTTSIPSGTSVGKYEAVELRDNDPKRFDSKGVLQSVSYINDLIAPKLIGTSPLKQQEIDYWMIHADATKNKNRLGANTILAVSQLLVKASAIDQHLTLFQYINNLYQTITKEKIIIEKIPTPIFNVINGGKHANNALDFQEYQIIPTSSLSFSQAYQMGVELFHELKKVLQYRNADVTVGEEGGLTPNFGSNLDPFEVLNQTIMQKDLKVGFDVFLGTDIAASHFYKNDRYVVKDKSHPLTREEYLQFLINLTKTYSILYLEDPLYEDDWDSWRKLNSAISSNVYLVGDDLLVTSKDRLTQAIKENACSAILIKPNQIGTITETIEVINLARKNKMDYIVSHRSGETNDCFIADFAVGVQSEFVKFGAPSRGERVVKYNRLWQIEREEIK
jgi:enolase